MSMDRFAQATRDGINFIAQELAEPLHIARRLLPRVQPRLVTMVYHDVPREHEEIFIRQLRLLAQYYDIVDLAEFSRRHATDVVPRDTILLTFDDAYSSSSRVARILNELGLRGVFFVPVGFIDCSAPEQWWSYICQNLFFGRHAPGTLSPELRPASWDVLRSLVASGHSIGCHTHSHVPLHLVDTPSRRHFELIASADRLEMELGCEVDAFAMPFGTVDSITPAVLSVLDSRFQHVFTSVRGDNRQVSRLTLRRETVSSSDAPGYVLFQAAGGLTLAYREAQRRLERLAKICEKGVGL